MRQANDAVPKKQYETPKLLVYGDLTEMTKGKITKLGNFDNGVMGPKT
jgi:hypothetical protein